MWGRGEDTSIRSLDKFQMRGEDNFGAGNSLSLSLSISLSLSLSLSLFFSLSLSLYIKLNILSLSQPCVDLNRLGSRSPAPRLSETYSAVKSM